MEILIIILAVGIASWLILKFLKNQNSGQVMDQPLILIQNQLNEISRTLDEKIGESSKQMHEHLKYTSSETAKIVRDITEKLTKLDETNKQVIGFADQLKSLQDILKNPKQRGILGEYYLETVLKNVLPPGSFQMQYPFKNGEIVDAVIFYQDKIIPVDSKFSLENYNRLLEAKTDEERKLFESKLRDDLKNRIDETSKYVRPEEDTVEFAFMFIPSEALYYDLLINKVGSVNSRDLVEYAVAEKKVFVVSPTSFLAYLQTVIQGLRQQEINRSAEQIRKNIGELSKHLAGYDVFMQKLGNSLGTTVNNYTKAYKEFKKIDKDIMKITDNSIGIEPMELEKPQVEEEEEKSLF